MDAITPSMTAKPTPERAVAVRAKLTEQRVAALPTPVRGATYTYDSVDPSLAVRVSAAGVRSFVVVKKIYGKTQRINLGRFPGLRLDDARQAARGVAGDLANGIDPVAKRKAARARKATLADLWPAYLAHIKQRNRTWARDKRRWETDVGPTLGRKALVDITRGDCQALIDKIGADRAIAANRVAALLSALLNFAVRSDRLAVNPARGLVRFQESSRARVIKTDELPRLLAAIDLETAPWADLFKMLFFTGARRSNIAAMRWDNIDLKTATWTIPAANAKNKTATALPLTDPALTVLQRRLTYRAGEAWVFPSPIGNGHVVNLTKPWERILKRAEIADLHIHDVRRSVGTTLARAGASPHIIATGLGHRSIASAKAYVRLAGEDARQALDDAVATLTGAQSKGGSDAEC